MTQAFGDDQFERELRAVLNDRAEEIASRAHTAPEMTAVIAPRLLRRGRTGAREMLLRLAAAAVILLLLLIAVVVFGSRPSRPAVNLLLAIDLPLHGEPAAPPLIDAVHLAIRQAHLPAGVSVDLPPEAIFDDSVDGSATVEQGAANMARIVGDPRYAAVIGPFHSFVARAAMPIANQAGLLQCSATNTDPGLTIGPGAVSLRPRLDRPTFVRLAATDDAAAAAAAQLLVGVLAKQRVFVVTSVEPFAGGRSETFARALEALGGSVAARGAIGEGGDDPAVVARQVTASGADSVFFDGLATYGGQVLKALTSQGSTIPFVGLDIVLDGPRSAPGSFLNVAGAGAGNAYGVFQVGRDATLGPQVEAAYESAFGRSPESFVLNGYACASVILDAIGRVDGSRLTTASDWREAVRAEVTAPGRTYATPIGTISFDVNGDVQPQRLSIYRADPNAGDWVFSQLLELQPGS